MTLMDAVEVMAVDLPPPVASLVANGKQDDNANDNNTVPSLRQPNLSCRTGDNTARRSVVWCGDSWRAVL